VQVMLNPRLIVWPGSPLSLLIEQDDGSLLSLGSRYVPLIRLLRSWIGPVSALSVDEMLLARVADVTSARLLEDRVLITAGSHAKSEAWSGFRLCEADDALSDQQSGELVVEERREVDHPVLIIDNALRATCITALEEWFNRQTFSLADIDSERTSYSRHWVKPLDSKISDLLTVPLISWLDAITRNCRLHSEILLAEAKAYITPYGDVPTYHKDSERGPTITAVLFAHKQWQLDWGGELIIADMGGEPKIAIAPKPGRLVVFRGDLPHKAGAPSRVSSIARSTLVLRYEALT